MIDSSFFRSTTAALIVVAIATGGLTGCEFLGFGDEGATVVDNDDGASIVDNEDENDTENQNQQNDPQQNEDPNQQEPDEQVVTLFDEQVTVSGGYSDYVEFDVPEEVYAIAISITETNELDNYMVTDWTAPDGFELVPAGWEDGSGQVCYPDCNLRIMMAPGAFGAVAPNNPDAEPGIQPGTHQFQVVAQNIASGFYRNFQAGHDVRVTVHGRVAVDEVPQEGKLDLNLFFTNAENWSAAGAEDNTRIQGIVDDIDAIYDQVGIDIGEVAYHDVEGDYEIISDMFSASGDLAQLLSQAENAELDGPSVFFVQELESPFGGGGGGAILGISGGIPGPGIVSGSPRNGVAVATEMSSGWGAPGIASVTAHELGHYMGLFHTSEHGGGGWGSQPSHDPLPDTEQNDESYLMHASGHGDEMSEWQGRVMRNTPWVYQEE